MSCQIKVLANIVDVGGIRRCLFPVDDDRGSDNWLQNCCISFSPTGEIIVLAHSTRIVVLTAKWDSNTVLNQYHITYSGPLEDTTDPITAVLCLPIASQSKSSQIGPDWTCIAVGFESGLIKFYTDNCNLLFSEHLHDERVLSIKCQSQSSYLDGNNEVRPEEVYILYPSSVCMYSGQQLIPALRNFRSQLARVQAQGDSYNSPAPFLSPKKWGFTDQVQINDMIVVGSSSINTFDHLLAASTCGGFDAKYRAVAPSNALVVGVGNKPYVGFHLAIEGVAQPVFSDVAKAVANKLKSALPGWLVGSKSAEEKNPQPTMQPAEPMNCRFGLCDTRRTGDSIIMSPDKKLSIITDSLGRIALIDNKKGVVIRLWKGYRGAQCCFLQVPDEEKTKSKGNHKKQRVALFLIIYTPKKGTIEIWALQQGPRIVTFTASKFSKLIYNNYGLLGFGNTLSKSKHGYHFGCSLIDPDGQVKEIIVPFHFSLPEKNSKRTRDLHLFKKLKTFLKSEEYDLEKLCSEVVNTCSEIKTNVVRLQCFDMLIASRYMQPKAMFMMTEAFLDKLNSEDITDDDVRKLITLNQNLKLIVDFYSYIEDLPNDMDDENGNIPSDDQPQGKIDTTLVISEKEMNNLQRLLDLSTLSDYRKLSEPKVSFQFEKKTVFIEYLSVFDLTSETNNIFLKNDITDDKLYRISEVIFNSFISSKRDDTETLQEQMLKTNIRVLDLIKMLLSFWINRSIDSNINLNNEMQNFSKVLYSICSTTSIEKICTEHNTVSPFWTEIRDYLTDSPKPFPALTAAILCRSIAQKFEQLREQECSTTSIEEDTVEIWEKLTQENCNWTLLIGKLEDISILNIILSNKPIIENCTLPKLYYERSIVSLKYVLNKGRGSISELVAQWLASGGIDPSYIALNSLCDIDPDITNELNAQPIESGSVDIPSSPSFNEPIFEQLNILKKQFPYSLEASAILSNMAWEYALNWHKDIKNFPFLEAGLKCLQHIPSIHIKQGLYNLMWTTHIRETFEVTCKLINKVGKIPKEILCKQDTGLTDAQIPLFIEICSEFLDHFLDTVQQSYGVTRSILKFENLWENGGTPLTELALQQSEINSSLLHIHYQLSLVIQMMTTFGVKQIKPIANLFDSSTLNLFFTDLLQKIEITTHSSEKKLQTSRTQFLVKIISSSIETVRIVDDNLYSLDHVNWMAKCILLANEWGVDTDLLRRHQVLQIFINGFNELGEEILPSITETELLGPDLLAVAGKQLKQVLRSSPDLTAKIVALSPSLQRYLETMNRDWVANSTLESITRLAEHVVRCLPDSNNYSRYAGLLLEACVTLQDMEK